MDGSMHGLIDGLDVLVGTTAGVYRVGARIDEGRVRAGEVVEELGGVGVGALALDGDDVWAVTDSRAVWRRAGDGEGRWEQVFAVEDAEVQSLLPGAEEVVVGISGPHLLRFDRTSGELARIEGFEHVETRDKWGNPDGRPADARSLARGPEGRLYANVHVGGIIASEDAGETWQQTSLDIWADVHQVIAPAADRIYAATGLAGLVTSSDGGQTWSEHKDGFPSALEVYGLEGARYCRAVAIAGDTLLVTASTGPETDQAGIFRRPLGSDGAFEQCPTVPEWFPDNIDTGCLTTRDGIAAFGSADGSVYVSADEGRSWERVATGLAPILCVTAPAG
jgi:hypothetical protein